MKKLFSKLFPPIEVESFKKHCTEFLRRNFDDELLYLDLIEIGLEQQIHKYANDNPDKIIEPIRLKHVHVEDLVIRVVANSCRMHISSGRLDDGRGNLNPSGHRLLKLVESGFLEAVAKGFMEKDAADRILSNFKSSFT